MQVKGVILGILLILPVLAAQYFSVTGGVITLASALVSAYLWVAFITMVPQKIANPVLRSFTAMTLVTVLAVYFFAQLISYYLQGSYFNAQFFFHMNLSSITETWGAYYPLALIFVAWMASIWLAVWSDRNKPGTNKKSSFYVLAVLLLAILFDPGLRTSSVYAAQSLVQQPDKRLDSIEWEKLQLHRSALERNIGPALPGKNLVMVFMEGFDKLYTDEGVFPKLTPNLNALNAQSWQLENLQQLESGTGWTMAGLVSTMCGTPLLHEWDFSGNNIMLSGFLDRAVCLPDILREAGYRQTFMGGASLLFGGKGIFLNQHSFDHVYGRIELTKRLNDPSYLGGWGLYDDSLFDLAFKEFEAYGQDNDPFNLTLLTVDTHHPTGDPSHSCPKYSEIDNSILHAVHCTDYLVGRFVEQLQSNPAYANTIVVLLADHLAMRNNAFSLFPHGYDRRLYFNVLNSGLHGSSNELALPMDLAPTILHLLGVTHQSSFLAGRDILSNTGDSNRMLLNDATRVDTIAFLNSNFLTSPRNSERQTILLDAKLYDFQHDIADVELSEGKVTFRATGKDPYIILPEIENLSGGPMTMIIDLDTPAPTRTSVFYKNGWYQKYSDERARYQVSKAGKQKVVLPLPADADHDRIKFDPGEVEGEYTIRSIEIQM